MENEGDNCSRHYLRSRNNFKDGHKNAVRCKTIQTSALQILRRIRSRYPEYFGILLSLDLQGKPRITSDLQTEYFQTMMKSAKYLIIASKMKKTKNIAILNKRKRIGRKEAEDKKKKRKRMRKRRK